MEERLKQGGASLRKTSHCRQNVKVLPAGISLRFGTKSVFKQRTVQALRVKLPSPTGPREREKKQKGSALTCLGFLLPLRVTFSGASTPALPFPSFLAQHLEADVEKAAEKHPTHSFRRWSLGWMPRFHPAALKELLPPPTPVLDSPSLFHLCDVM